MTIAVKYEDGVFTLLEDVKLWDGTEWKCTCVRPQSDPFPKSLRELAACGMWADRDAIPDGVT
jgi:predicted DNA-binding antitoxin AbrB/MazE fold protein